MSIGQSIVAPVKFELSTANRFKEITIPFELKDIPLP